MARASRFRPVAAPLRWSLATLALLLPAALHGQATGEPAGQKNTGQAVTSAEYVARLQALDQLVAACRAATTAANCSSAQVGPDLQIHLPSGDRAIRFGWLRSLLDEAAGVAPKTTARAPVLNPLGQPVLRPGVPDEDKPLTVAQHLDNARARLAEDLRWAETASGAGKAVPGNGNAASSAKERAQLTAILASPEYHAIAAGPTLRQRILEQIGTWIDDFLGKLAEAGAHARWIGITAEVLFVVVLCVALAWFLIRLEKQGRFVAASLEPGAGAASARDWQLWLDDARMAAGRKAWRDAIHLLYWASISRLESSGLWPADRARTPREYLSLMSAESRQRPNLAALTRSFERTWYGGWTATQADFQQAEQLAAELGAKRAERVGAQ